MTTLPSIAVRNAIAFVDYFGSFPSHCHYETRRLAERAELDENDQLVYRWVRLNSDYNACSWPIIRFYLVTDEGRKIAERSTLAQCLRWLTENGFEYRPDIRTRKGKRSAIFGFRHPETGAEAWISGFRRVYVNAKAEERRFSSELAFEA